MDHKATHLGAQMAPIEGEGSNLHFSAGGLFHRGYDLLANHIAEPIGLNDDDTGDDDNAARGPRETQARWRLFYGGVSLECLRFKGDTGVGAGLF